MKPLVCLAVTVLALATSSCGPKDNRKPTFPVTGQVLDGSKPIANATVVFHPVDDKDPNAVKPRGKTDAEGKFSLTTYDGNDGAPAGKYQVTVELWLAGRADEGPSSRLPVRFANPQTSGFHADVAAGSTNLQPFIVKK